MAGERTYSIGELAAACGVSRRTVRFYVQRGLLAPPLGLGRGARYNEAHLTRLREIRAGHEHGVPLEELGGAAPSRAARRPRRKAATPPTAPPRPKVRPEPAPEPEQRDTWWAAWDEAPAAETAAALRYVPGQTWLRQPLAMGYEFHVPTNRAPLSTRQLNELVRRLFELLEEEKRQ